MNIWDFLKWIFESFERWLGLVILVSAVGNSLNDAITGVVRGLNDLIRGPRPVAPKASPPAITKSTAPTRDD